MVGSPDSVQKNVVLENNSLSAEQITGVENRKSKAGEAVLPVLRSVSLFLLGLLGVLLILLTLLVIAAEAARIICLFGIQAILYHIQVESAHIHHAELV